MTEALDPVTPERLAEVFEDLDYPMYVVTAAAGGERAGCLVGFATQVSIDPPRLLACISVANRTHRVARAAELIAVHVLEPEDDALARLFGGETGDEVDKFAATSWREGPGGVPLLDQCRRRVVGRVREAFDLGDHTGFLLDPISAERGHGGPELGYQQVQGLEPGHPA